VLQNFYTTWVRGVACQKQRLGPKLEGAGLGEHPKIWDPLRISATVKASNFKFGTQLGFGTSLPKTSFWTKIGGVWARGASKKNFGTPYISLQLLKLATSNLIHKLGLGLASQKNDVLDQNWRGCGPAEHPTKIWDPLLISATAEASNFKFSTQFGFGSSLPKNNV